MLTRLFDGIKFCEQFLKRTYEVTFLPSLVQIGKQFGRCLKKLLATHTTPPESTLCLGELKNRLVENLYLGAGIFQYFEFDIRRH